MNVYDLCELYLIEDDKMKIYSLDKGGVIFEGSFEDAMHSEFYDAEICSFEISNGIICINID